MKHLCIIIMAAVLWGSCDNQSPASSDQQTKNGENIEKEKGGGDVLHYGLVEINATDAIPANEVIAKLEQQEGLEEIALDEETTVLGLKAAKVEGEVLQVCQHSGCWFIMKTNQGKELFISMKEHKSVPKDWVGKTVVAQGDAFIREISVEELQYAAKEEGLSEEEIEKITEPRFEFELVAEGAILKS